MSNGKDTLNARKKLLSLVDFDNGIKHGIVGANGQTFTATKCQFDVGVGLVSPEGQARARKLFKVLAENNIVGKNGFGCFMRSYTNAEKEQKLAAQRAEQSTRDASMAELLLEAMALNVPRAELAATARRAYESHVSVRLVLSDYLAKTVNTLQRVLKDDEASDGTKCEAADSIDETEKRIAEIAELSDAYEAEKAK